MMLRRFTPTRLPCGRHTQVVRTCAHFQQSATPSSGPVAAALAAAFLLMGTPALAIETEIPATSLSYEQQLQSLIEARTGKAALPELTEIPGEKAIQDNVEREFIEEAAAEEQAEVFKATEEPESAVKVQAIRESEAAKTASAPTAVKPASGAGPEGVSQTTIILLGAVATVGIAGVALSSNGSAATPAAPPAAAPSDPPPPSATPAADAPPPPPLA